MKRIAVVIILLSLFAYALLAVSVSSKANGEASQNDNPIQNANIVDDDVTQQSGVVANEYDPDLPSDVKGINKEDYLRQREDYNSLRRGLERGRPFDPRARGRAIQIMEMQEALQVEKAKLYSRGVPGFFGLAPTDIPVWTALGPAPLPNGALGGFTGRVTAVVVDPTNSNKVYLGTAQGGVWRSLNGGTTWESIFDNAQTQAVGSLALAPSNPSILYVGTGESNRSADSFFGIGVYRIDNVDSSYNLVGPINPAFSYHNGSGTVNTTTFTGRSISQIIVHPSQPGTIFVATSSGVGGSGANALDANLVALLGLYRSTNADGPLGAITFQKLAVATAGGSVDVPATGNRRITDVVMEPGNPDNLIVGVFGNIGLNDGGIFRTTNALDPSPTFTNVLNISTTRIQFGIHKDFGSGVVKVLAATSETPTTLSCPQAATQQGVLRQSVDGGATWTNPSNPAAEATATTAGILVEAGGFCGGQCFYNVVVAIDPRDSNLIYLGGNVQSNCSGLMLRSTNGVSFGNDASGLHADSHALWFDPIPNPSVVFTGNDGGVWKRSASAVTGSLWTNLNGAPLNTLQFEGLAVHPIDRNITLGGTQDNGTELQQTVSQVWTNSAGGDGGYALIDQSATDNANTTMYHTFFFSSGSAIRYQRVTTLAAAAARTWTTIGCSGGVPANGITCGDSTLFYAPMALGPGTPNPVYLGSDRLYRSDDRGNNHAVVSQAPISGGSPVSSIGISPQDDNYRVVGLQNGQVWATSTGSSTLVNVTGGAFPANPNGSATNRFVGAVAVDPNNKDVAYVAFSFFAPSGQGVWKITNLGAAASAAPASPTWLSAGAGIPSVPINGLAIDPANSNHIYAGTDIGVYNSTDGGVSWNPYGDGLPRSAVFGVAIQGPHRLLRIATHGRGMWEIPLPSPTSGGANTVQFSSSTAGVTEAPNATIKVDLTVNRSGDTSAAASVKYASSNATANDRSDYEPAAGTLQFAAGETSKTITVFIVDDSYSEGPETFNVTLSGAIGCTLGATPAVTVTITSDDPVNGPNPILSPEFFVRQHYLDFFNREPDSGGLAFWTNEITSCGANATCIDLKRTNVSAAFYVSIEFRETGYLVYRMYKAGYGNLDNGSAPVPVRFAEFLPDTQQIGNGVIVGVGDWQSKLNSNKVAFAQDFVSRATFVAKHPTSLTPAQFVDALFANGGFTPSNGDRTAAINEFAGASNTVDTDARARALRLVAENATLTGQEFSKAFVLMQYFGYLRRNPYDPPESTLDYGGYNFWLNKLNQFNGNYVNAEMVRAFIVSDEYRLRFGP